MSFLYPAFLWALTALSIPVIIHLFNFRKTQTYLFSTTRFLRNVQEATTAKRKFKHYLILASRIVISAISRIHVRAADHPCQRAVFYQPEYFYLPG
jgi:hypothetical protein